ncbi:SusC/RagA family TonB-linked outer membrane protein [Pedobacter miscanthi]|uniref:SusC/RagA family TonB-linked outer membrane protein n=1 Tax=Pedobacter miscanthi TaxID=2259170 RepID=UPI00292D75B0|nr:SusC/RagA family TonB-linked outer membrane protein [Pedobacter miscanthi]
MFSSRKKRRRLQSQLMVFLLLLCFQQTYAQLQEGTGKTNNAKATDTVTIRKKHPVISKDTIVSAYTPRVSALSIFPASSLQQSLKGNYAGLYIQEPSGEPGTVQNMFIRGSALPLLSKRELYDAQPLVVLDGIPMVTEHPYAFDIQQFDFNRIGTATNIFSNIDLDNLASIEILKDVQATALYGPRGINGVILLKTKPSEINKRIEVNSYVGFAQKPSVTTINGQYENAFRQRFYDLYTANGRYSKDETYPAYLSDSLSNSYYGPSNWNDLYYKNGVVYAFNASITAGMKNANFRFSLGNLKNEGVADQTALNRYSSRFEINMRPIKWLDFSVMANANRVERDRNRSLRDRFSQMNYFPDLTSPLSPNADVYGKYLAAYDNSYDNNKTNIIEGFANVGLHFGKINFMSRMSLDYNEGYRDVFLPKPLIQNTSYVSNYYGYSQRAILDNVITYDIAQKNHAIHLQVGQSTQWTTYKYNYSYAYKGVSDFIKLNLLDGETYRPGTFPSELVFRFLDRTNDNLSSFYGNADYVFKNKYSFSTILRLDGSSNAQPTKRWFFSPTVSANWNIKNEFFEKNNTISELGLKIGAGRIGRINSFDSYSQGPQYSAYAGYTGNLTVPGYTGFSVLSRPYSFGWIGYGIPWAYSDQLNIGFTAGLFNNRVKLYADLYTKTEKNLLVGIPDGSEYGYSQSFEPGMSVNNNGIDIVLNAMVLSRPKGTNWNASLSFNINKNKLKALPRGLEQVSISEGTRLLKVGQPIDSYWLFINDGIYTTDAEVPVVNGQPLKFNGNIMKAGDPKWRDVNNDNVINDQDKVFTGHSLPVLSGNFNNTITLGKFDLNINIYYNLGRDLINENMANRFNFINREGQSNINSVKEITFWEKSGDYSLYPLYNPWSPVEAYRLDQTLFLEDASFMKLRTVSLGYDLTKFVGKKAKFTRFYIYGTVNNIFTVTKYSGRDPELADYNGYDNGYGLPIPRTYSFGIKAEL